MHRSPQLRVLYDSWMAERKSLSEKDAFDRFRKALRELHLQSISTHPVKHHHGGRGHRFFGEGGKAKSFDHVKRHCSKRVYD